MLFYLLEKNKILLIVALVITSELQSLTEISQHGSNQRNANQREQSSWKIES